MVDELEKLSELFIRVLTPHCPYCNAELDKYAFYDWQGAYRVCPKCKRRIRE